MKRNIDEIYNLINQKIENAKNDFHKERMRMYPSTKKQFLLEGEIQAYTDIKILLETSGVLKDE